MKFNTIFAPYLHAVVLDDEIDEFDRFIRFLSDAIQLEAYFNENQNVLAYYNISIEDAIDNTLDLVPELYDYIEQNKNNLNNIFEPLKKIGGEHILHKMKFKSDWLRLYAIKVESQYFIITGGAIKQSQKMSDHIGTEKQLGNLNKVRDYLIDQGINDIDGFFALINE
ncbi:MAG: hypothetical protein KBE91_09385 [Bacteroidia bacterium]|nr:hypothetical protein [Bacteroidia bacterium]MBP9689810.1 hypothetical protein [Bacteroidia bacterium]